MNLSKFFDPESIAVIGASSKKESVGYSLTFNLVKGKKRIVYPINPQYKKVLGLTCRSSVSEIDGKIDLALIAVRADVVPLVLEECGKKKIPFAIIIASGFKETGQRGKELEDKLKSIAKKYGISLLGPNCLGILDSHSDLNASFSAEKPLKGSIAFISQSGALGASMLDWGKEHGIGFSKFVSLGNEAGFTEIDFLEHFAGDKNTKAIMMYLEKVSDGKKFMKLAKKITGGKPIVVIKAGRSKKGISAVMSHTGSLAGEDLVFNAACRECGVVTVESISEFFNFAKLFQLGILKPVNNLAVLTNGGGPSVVAADLIDLSISLELAELKESTKKSLFKVLPPMAAVNNPIDIIGDALSSRYFDALKILSEDKNIGAIMVMLTPQMMTQAEETAKTIASFIRKKPIISVFIGGKTVKKGIEFFKKKNLVNFDFPEDAVGVLDLMFLGNKSKKSEKSAGRPEAELKMLGFPETQKILAEQGIRIPGMFLKTKEELTANFGKFKGEPLAMKVVSSRIVHKTEAGGVKINLKNIEEALRAWDEITESARIKIPGAEIEGMVVQPMARGKEVIIGMKRDRIFGPTILFGLGGIFAEAIKDISMRVAPISEADKQMVKEIKGYKILNGLRGDKAVDFKKIEELIVAVSHLSLSRPDIIEIDLNPVMVTDSGATVVDARIMTAK